MVHSSLQALGITRFFYLAGLSLVLAPLACGGSDDSKGSHQSDAGASGAGAEAGSASGSAGQPAGEGGTDSAGGSNVAGASPSGCGIAADCGAGQQCVSSVCVDESTCRNSRDCSSQLVCSDSGRCVECVSDIECGTDLLCVGNACRPACASDRDCRALNMLCDRGPGRCVECIVNADCPSDRECRSGTCVTTSLGTGGSGGDVGLGGAENGGNPGSGGEGPSEGGSPETAGGSGNGGGLDSGGTAGVGTAGSPGNGGTAEIAGQVGVGGSSAGSAGVAQIAGAPGIGGAPVVICGNGVLQAGEGCDDGNTESDDCCSASCEIESGCQCTQTPAGAETIVIPATYRDFLAGGDFEPYEATDLNDPTIGFVESTLDAEGKPAYLGPGGGTKEGGFVVDAASYAQWYRDVPGTNQTLNSSLTLYSNGSGSYANRYGANGEQWSTSEEVWCGYSDMAEIDAEGNPIPCTYCITDEDPELEGCQGHAETSCDDMGRAPDDCTVEGSGTYYGIFRTLYEGSPAFFPADSMTFTPEDERSYAVIPPFYGGRWAEEPNAPLHNFHFTSEFRFSFQFTGSETLEVSGDDDVWVFIDGKLAVDVGGIHTPVSGTLTFTSSGDGSAVVQSSEPEGDGLTTTQDTALGLVAGQIYEIAVFQAERKIESSTFRLRLQNFNMGPSQCSR